MRFLSLLVSACMFSTTLTAGTTSSSPYHAESSMATSFIANAMAFNIQLSEELRTAIEEMDSNDFEMLDLSSAGLMQEIQGNPMLIADFKGAIFLGKESAPLFNQDLWPALEGLGLVDCKLPDDLSALKSLKSLHINRAAFNAATDDLFNGYSKTLPMSLDYINVYWSDIGPLLLTGQKTAADLYLQGFKFVKN